MRTTTIIWEFRDAAGQQIDLTGFKVEAVDGAIGKIDAEHYETGADFIVVDTGPWIFGKKVMLPAGVIQGIDPDEASVYVDRTKDEIKAAPEFDADRFHESSYRDQLGGHYDADRGLR